MVRKEPASAGFLWPEKSCGMWPFPCNPKELTAAAVLWVGLARRVTRKIINKNVNTFPTRALRISGAMFNGAPLRAGCWRPFQRYVATGHLGCGVTVRGYLVGVLLAGHQPACQTTAPLSL